MSSAKKADVGKKRFDFCAEAVYFIQKEICFTAKSVYFVAKSIDFTAEKGYSKAPKAAKRNISS